MTETDGVYKKCTIVNIDSPSTQIPALYNPNKVKIARNVPWMRHQSLHSNNEMLEFKNAKNRTLSVELFFDGYEDGIDVCKNYVARLTELTCAPEINAESRRKERARRQRLMKRVEKKGHVENRAMAKEAFRQGAFYRPPLVMLVWGDFPPFRGVIESLDAEYSMFTPSGKPVRANCSLTIVELDKFQLD